MTSTNAELRECARELREWAAEAITTENGARLAELAIEPRTGFYEHTSIEPSWAADVLSRAAELERAASLDP